MANWCCDEGGGEDEGESDGQLVLFGVPAGVPALGVQLSEKQMEACQADENLHTGEPPDDPKQADAWNKLVRLAKEAWPQNRRPATMLWALLIGRDVEGLAELTEQQLQFVMDFRINDRLHWRSDFITFFLGHYVEIEMAPGESLPLSAL